MGNEAATPTETAKQHSEAYGEVFDGLEVLGDNALRDVMAKCEALLLERKELREKQAITEAKALLREAGIKNLSVRRKQKRESK
jgi:hypothetical protein